MNRLSTLVAILALAACSPKAEEAPLRAPLVKAPAGAPTPATPAPAPAPAPPVSPAPEPPAPPKPAPPEPATPAPRPPAPPPPAPKREPRPPGAIAKVHLPAFSLRTMDHRAAKVWLNGEEVTETPMRWTVTEAVEFDPKVAVATWPPAGAKYVGATQHPEHADWNAEVYVSPAGAAAGTAADESLLYVRSTIEGTTRQGALRLRIQGYHYENYIPPVSPDSDEASRFLRTLWFERTNDQ